MENQNETTPETPMIMQPVSHGKPSRVLRILGIIVLIALGYYAGRVQGIKLGRATLTDTTTVATVGTTKDPSVDFGLYWKVWDVLHTRYVGAKDLDSRALFQGSLKGMMAATGDPYTTFFSMDEMQDFSEALNGSFEGIGAELGMKDDILTIVAPIDDSPAAKAGIKAGDKIAKIDGVTTDGMQVEDAVKKIRGKGGTDVVLTIYREGESQPLEIRITRGVVVIHSIKTEIRPDGLAWVRLSRFGDDTTADFDAAIAEMNGKQVKGMVLDMRNNPGGLLETAIGLASRMIDPNLVVVMEENAKGDKKERKSSRSVIQTRIPVVVLVNEGSASASEILAAALRDNRLDVRVVGKTTFGKGSVQELIPLTGKTAAKVTIARWLTPKGEQINHVGIKPDVEVDVTKEDVEAKVDAQKDRAFEELLKLVQVK